MLKANTIKFIVEDEELLDRVILDVYLFNDSKYKCDLINNKINKYHMFYDNYFEFRYDMEMYNLYLVITNDSKCYYGIESTLVGDLVFPAKEDLKDLLEGLKDYLIPLGM